MFKRLFLLSGILAFFLACAMMWFWYLPKEVESQSKSQTTENQIDTTAVVKTDSIAK
ncbi:hypothetical protein OAE48_02500 [Flavobacteriales bacterium]|nr:hypothetical protein [Flavobacteriales bacterium]